MLNFLDYPVEIVTDLSVQYNLMLLSRVKYSQVQKLLEISFPEKLKIVIESET